MEFYIHVTEKSPVKLQICTNIGHHFLDSNKYCSTHVLQYYRQWPLLLAEIFSRTSTCWILSFISWSFKLQFLSQRLAMLAMVLVVFFTSSRKILGWHHKIYLDCFHIHNCSWASCTLLFVIYAVLTAVMWTKNKIISPCIHIRFRVCSVADKMSSYILQTYQLSTRCRLVQGCLWIAVGVRSWCGPCRPWRANTAMGSFFYGALDCCWAVAVLGLLCR